MARPTTGANKFLRYEFGSWHGVVEIEAGAVRAHWWSDDPKTLAAKTSTGADNSRLARLLSDYFRGLDADPAHWPIMPLGASDFQAKVYQAVRRIPYGQTATYGEIASVSGRPGAARAVGNVMAHNPLPLFVPCHRVRAASGPGGWSGPPGWKDRLLALEASRSPRLTVLSPIVVK